MYRVGTTLQAVRFDLDELDATGPPVTVVDRIAPVLGGGDQGGAHYAVSENGTLFYVARDEEGRRVVWLDRQGENVPLALAPALFSAGARLSPDEDRVAVERDSDIWVHDIDRGTTSRLTFTGNNSRPLWTPDGKAIVFASRRNGINQVFLKPADGSGNAGARNLGRLLRQS